MSYGTWELGSGVDVTWLTRRFSRRALPRRNLAYYLWRFMANGVRTGRALTSRPSCSQTPAIGRELTEQGIVVGPSERFLTKDGQRALSEAAARILHASRSENVEAVITGAATHTHSKAAKIMDMTGMLGAPTRKNCSRPMRRSGSRTL